MHDFTKAELDSQTRGMLDYAVKLTREPEVVPGGGYRRAA